MTTIAPFEDLTRREFIASTLAAALVIACGDDDEEDASDEASTRRIETPMGPVDIPVAPQRVICTAPYSWLALVDAGLPPLAFAGAGSNLPSRYAAVAASLPNVGVGTAIDYEAVLALDPDLILGMYIDGGTDENYRKLSEIAPMVLVRITTWDEQAAHYLDAVGQPEALQSIEQEYEAKCAAIRSTHAGKLAATKFALATGGTNDWNVYYPDFTTGVVLANAGLQFASAAVGKTGRYGQFSFEQVNVLADADVILLPGAANGGPADAAETLVGLENWSTLPAVAAGRVFYLKYLVPMSYGSALDLLDEFEAVLRSL